MTEGRPYRVLALDGGGIRGIITAYWLKRLEEELGDRVGNRFDLIAGTSTGSILACAVALRIPAAEIVELYQAHGSEVFPPPPSCALLRLLRFLWQGLTTPLYDDAALERVLRTTFGEACFGNLPHRPVVLVTAYDTFSRQAIVFKSTRRRYAHVPLWEAVKASSSAPTYFPAHVTRALGRRAPLIDGGVVAKNPTACAIAEALRITADQASGSVPLRDLVVASLGTGQATRPISISKARQWGSIQWVRPLIDVIMDGGVDAADYIARQLIPQDRYFRFQTCLDKASDAMDDASEKNLAALLAVADDYLRAWGGDRMIGELAALLG
jgi:patatin-like phospholipase/acyl hydrolase